MGERNSMPQDPNARREYLRKLIKSNAPLVASNGSVSPAGEGEGTPVEKHDWGK